MKSHGKESGVRFRRRFREESGGRVSGILRGENQWKSQGESQWEDSREDSATLSFEVLSFEVSKVRRLQAFVCFCPP